MTDHEQEDFELQLRKTKLAQPPAAFTAGLLSAVSRAKTPAEVEPAGLIMADYLRILFRSLRWLAPATVVLLVVVMLWRSDVPSGHGPAEVLPSRQGSAAVTPLLKADEVKIDQQLVSSFDAVARLPGGEPVRFRCENWMDQVVLSDKAHGVIAENRHPRFEVVALGFETY